MTALRSIRQRMLAALLGVVGLTALAIGLVSYRSVLAETEALFDYQLRQMALSLRDYGMISSDQADVLNNQQLDVVVQIWALDGRLLYSSQPASGLPTRAVLGFADLRGSGPGSRTTWRVFSAATPTRVIQVAQPLQVRRHLAADAALNTVTPLLLLAPLLGALGWWLMLVSLRPLERMAREVRQRDALALDPLPADGLPTEIEPLVSALNALLARLGAQFDAQRAFVGDAAHELRTPLTALKLQLRALQRAPDTAARQQAEAALGAGIERAQHLIEQLLALARNEPGNPALALSRVDLTEAVRHGVADVVPLALAQGSEIELLHDAPVWVQGDAAALRLLARNLADNALRYSGPCAKVQLDVQLDQPGSATSPDGCATLIVDDSGPGIPAAERQRVFDRFYRRAGNDGTHSGAAASTVSETGSGLGLALVQRIAERHQASVTLSDAPLGGLRASVRLPLASGV
jgi:two-component system OmpR family sensor kinase/two-component system sensor histidine kinase QseC